MSVGLLLMGLSLQFRKCAPMQALFLPVNELQYLHLKSSSD
jgi:hypothetical protein